jgi:hypothetical protein
MFRTTTGLATLALLLFSGCGGSADEGGGTVHVSGDATFAGKPIPAGKIYFAPDPAKGNSGASGYATIEDGTFNTADGDGKATVGGATVVRIEGFDPAQTSTNEESGEEVAKSLFPTYETKVDLPKETTTKNFDVPAEAAKPAPGGGDI